MDFDAVCRTCMNSCSSLKPIFRLPSDYLAISKTIFVVTGIKVAINDGLPQKICGHCSELVNSTIKFRKICRKVDHTLRCIKNRVKGSISTENEIIEDIVYSETDNEHSDTDDEVIIKHIDDETLDDDDEPMKSVLEQNTINKKTNECKTTANATLDVVKVERESNNDNENYVGPNVLSSSDNLQHTNCVKGFVCYKNKKKNEKVNDTKVDVTGNSDQTKQIPIESLDNQYDSGQNNSTTENLLDDDTFSDNQLIATDFNSLYDADFSDPTGKRVKCRFCLKSLSIRSIDVHLSKSHPGSDPRRVKCKLCDCFVMKKRLLRHRLQVHGSLECRFCKRNFDQVDILVQHVVTCSERFKRRHPDLSRELTECGVCKEKMQKGSLRRHHAVKHAGLRPVCEHCGRSFGNNLRLEEHCRAKQGYEKFSCTRCEFRCASVMGMRNHERRHLGEKPYVCEACGANFHAAYLLAQHRKSHRTERLFKCGSCASRFKTSNARHAHSRAVHGHARVRTRRANTTSAVSDTK